MSTTEDFNLIVSLEEMDPNGSSSGYYQAWIHHMGNVVKYPEAHNQKGTLHDGRKK